MSETWRHVFSFYILVWQCLKHGDTSFPFTFVEPEQLQAVAKDNKQVVGQG